MAIIIYGLVLISLAKQHISAEQQNNFRNARQTFLLSGEQLLSDIQNKLICCDCTANDRNDMLNFTESAATSTDLGINPFRCHVPRKSTENGCCTSMADNLMSSANLLFLYAVILLTNLIILTLLISGDYLLHKNYNRLSNNNLFVSFVE